MNFTLCALYCGQIEATFTQNVINNLQNLHEWVLENPHAILCSSLQQRLCQHLDQNRRWLPNWTVREFLIESSMLSSSKEHFLFYLRKCTLIFMRACDFSTNMPLPMSYARHMDQSWVPNCPASWYEATRFLSHGDMSRKILMLQRHNTLTAWSVKPW